MSEFTSETEQNFENERQQGLKEITSHYLEPEDAAFLDEMDEESEMIGYVYGRLLESGEEPEKILQEFNVIERDNT